MPIPDVQIAFQGGGAKFICMLPVAEAFQHCETKGRIRIKAIAGTSAGAICAGLIAAECDFPRLRTYIRSNGRRHIQSLIGRNASDLIALMQSTGLKRIGKLVKARSALHAVLGDGHSVLHEEEFGSFLRSMLECCKRGAEPIQSLTRKRKLSIIVTNLEKSSGEEVTAGSLEAAIRASCGLPIAFRSFQYLSRSHLVDGGLCDNLPINSLRSDLNSPIFAVFPEEAPDTSASTGIFPYLMSLFSAAIDNNVKIAKGMVSPAFHFPIKAGFSTFDFEKAMDLMDDDNWYERTKEDAIKRISDFSKSYGTLGPASQFRFDDTKIVDDYASALESITRDYDEYSDQICSQLIVQVHCADLSVPDEAVSTRPADSKIRRSKIKVKTAGFRYYRSSVRSVAADAVPSIWTAYNVTKSRSLPIKVLSLEKNVGTNPSSKYCLVEFLDPGANLTVDDEIHITETSFTTGGETMVELNRGRLDYMSISNPHKYALKQVELVLVYPAVLGKFTMEFNSTKSKGVPPVTTKINPTQEYMGVGTVTIGVRGANLPPGGIFYCDIIPQP